MIDGRQLEAGAYSLRVRKQASDEEALALLIRRPIRVVRAPGPRRRPEW